MILGFNCSTSDLVDLGLGGTRMQFMPSRDTDVRHALRIQSYEDSIAEDDSGVDSFVEWDDAENAEIRRQFEATAAERERERVAARIEVERARLPSAPGNAAPSGTISGSLRKLQDGIREVSDFIAAISALHAASGRCWIVLHRRSRHRPSGIRDVVRRRARAHR